MDTDVIAGHRGGHAHDPGADRLHPGRVPIDRFPYRPTRVLDSIADVVGMIEQLAPTEQEELSAD